MLNIGFCSCLRLCLQTLLKSAFNKQRANKKIKPTHNSWSNIMEPITHAKWLQPLLDGFWLSHAEHNICVTEERRRQRKKTITITIEISLTQSNFHRIHTIQLKTHYTNTGNAQIYYYYYGICLVCFAYPDILCVW